MRSRRSRCRAQRSTRVFTWYAATSLPRSTREARTTASGAERAQLLAPGAGKRAGVAGDGSCGVGGPPAAASTRRRQRQRTSVRASRSSWGALEDAGRAAPRGTACSRTPLVSRARASFPNASCMFAKRCLAHSRQKGCGKPSEDRRRRHSARGAVGPGSSRRASPGEPLHLLLYTSMGQGFVCQQVHSLLHMQIELLKGRRCRIHSRRRRRLLLPRASASWRCRRPPHSLSRQLESSLQRCRPR